MWKRIAVTFGIVVVFVAGILLGASLARQELASAVELVEAIARQSAEMAEQTQGNAERVMAVESLTIAKMLRDTDVDGVLVRLEATIEGLRAAIAANEGSPGSTRRDADILRAIGDYQASHPWVPPPSSPEDLALRFGRFTPHIQDGAVMGFRVSNVQPGSVLAQISVVSGDVITHYDGQPVSLERRPTLTEALQSGSGVDLVVRAPDGTVRQVQVPRR